MEGWLKSRECLNSTEELERFSRTLKVIAEPNPVRSLCLLRWREMCACQIVEELGLALGTWAGNYHEMLVWEHQKSYAL